MVMTLSAEETKALHFLGVYDCHNAGQLIQREDAIKRLYRRKALHTHPDRARARGGNPEQMERAFQYVSESYQLLMDRIVIQKGQAGKPVAKVKVQRESTRPGTQKSQSVAVGFYSGAVPAKKLRFAEYLYYKKEITWEQLVASLSWQFLNRPKLGEIARQKGWLTEEQILNILRRKKSSQRFGLVAVNNGLLSVDRCKHLLACQRRTGLPIGKYFTDREILSPQELTCYLAEFNLHNRRNSPLR